MLPVPDASTEERGLAFFAAKWRAASDGLG